MKKLSVSLSFFLTLSGVIYAQSDLIQSKQGEIKINPVLHASMVIEWQGKAIYIDPYGGSAKYAKFPKPDLILITDIHGDHMNKETLEVLDIEKSELIVPSAVKAQLGDLKAKMINSLDNGKKTTWQGIEIEAIPMYNLPETTDSRHPKGRGNGYVMTMGDKRIYISGDTEDITEMRQLKNIDLAFVCMNQPFTMDIDQAADAVLAFQPKIVYPFHYRGAGGKFSDVEAFKKKIEEKNKKIEVRLRNWYSE